MTRTPGQAARHGAREALLRHARRLHRLVQFCVGFGLASLVVLGLLAARLAEGPLEMAWLARTAAQALSADGQVVQVGEAEIAWEGLHGGVDRPLDIVLRRITVDNAAGNRLLDAPRMAVSLSLIDAMLGRFAPRAMALEDVSVRLALDLNGKGEAPDWRPALDRVLTGLRQPRQAQGSGATAMWSRLQRLVLSNATLDLRDVHDAQLALLQGVGFDLRRDQAGGARLTTQGKVQIDDMSTAMRMAATLPTGKADITASMAVDPFPPAALAKFAPALDPLLLVQLPVGVSGTARIAQGGAAGLALSDAQFDVTLGKGLLLIGDGVLPVRQAAGHLALTPETADLTLDRMLLQPLDSSTPSHVTAHVTARRVTLPTGPGLAAEVAADIDQVALDDLPMIWPLGTGGPGTRPWMMENTRGGRLSHGHVGLSLTAPEDFSDAVLSRLEGGIDGNDVSVTWLPTVPPIEHGVGRLTLTGPDTLEIEFSTGRQSGTNLLLRHGLLKMNGLAAHDQFLSLEANAEGPLADVLSVLHQPRIRLLERRHITINAPAGNVTALLKVNLPLKNDLTLDNVAISATGKLTDGHAGGLAAGRDIDRANFDFDISNAGLAVTGHADVLGVPVEEAVKMDFRPGPPSQVLLRVDATGALSADKLAALGLAHNGALTGATKGQFSYLEHRNGTGELAVISDLDGLGIADPRLAWRKAAASRLHTELHGELRGGRLTQLDRITADGSDATLRASAVFDESGETRVDISTLKLGDGTDLAATLRLPKGDAAAEIDLHGVSADFSGLLQHSTTKDSSARGPAYHLSAHLDRTLMANHRQWQDVTVDLASDGVITSHADVSATSGGSKVSLRISPVAGGRDMLATADDAGALLGAIDLSQRIDRGTLTASGHYDDTNAHHTLRGTADVENFSVRNAPAVARLLQAMSLYGLVEMAQGSGLGFTRAVAPFELGDDVMTLDNVRAYSASLGFTAKGQVNLDNHVADIEGTVIPAYFFNSLLGRMPLIGGLFSPEKDGGLLAVSYSIRGSLDDPRVGVNPLSAFTPGVLRGFFDLFNNTPTHPTQN